MVEPAIKLGSVALPVALLCLSFAPAIPSAGSNLMMPAPTPTATLAGIPQLTPTHTVTPTPTDTPTPTVTPTSTTTWTPAATPRPPVLPPPDWMTLGGQADARMGRTATGAGDVNGDGYDDLLVGAEWCDHGQTDEGCAYVFHGSAPGLPTQPSWSAEGNMAGAYFGARASSAGDVNCDGYDDIVVGASGYTGGQEHEGRAYVYLGSPDGLEASPAWAWESDQAGAQLGIVSTAGDVNGDGCADILVGAPLYDSGEYDEGKVFLFYGSAGGPAPVPGWTAESNQDGARFGNGMAGMAEDVNGDGYDDVIVGAHLYDNGQVDAGRAYLYLGSSTGLSSTPTWTADSDKAGAEFGVAVATAGDVNGDGFSDVVVGARHYEFHEPYEGAAFVYLGGRDGLSDTYTWMAAGNQAYAGFGFFAWTAGDQNGDGYDDLLVNAPAYDAGQIDEGGAFLYYGSASGLSNAPDWSAEANQENALFGYSGPGLAGDLNGDGCSDIAIGALWYDGNQVDEGAVFVYYGKCETPRTAIAAVHAGTPPTVDGDLTEWQALGRTRLNKGTAATITGAVPTFADLSSGLRAAWSPFTLYFAADISDDVLVGNNSSQIWGDDTLELGIRVGSATHQFSVALDGRQADQGNLITSLIVATRTVSGGWTLEVGVPAVTVGLSQFRADQSYPFTFGLWDDDLRTYPGQTHMIWQGTSTNTYSPNWGTLQLTGVVYNFPVANTPTPTATSTVEPVLTLTPITTPIPVLFLPLILR